MESTPLPDVGDILILRADRLYAELLRQYALHVYPNARIKMASSIDAAETLLAAGDISLIVTGIGPSLRGDVLDLLQRCATRPGHGPRVLVVTAGCEYRVLSALRTLSVGGVFDSATEDPDSFLRALQIVAAGGRFWSQSVLDYMERMGVASTAIFRLLTAFEQVVLSTIGDGSDDAAAARSLGLSPATVSTVRRELHRKLGVQHRGELVRVAAQHGFVRFTPAGVIRPGYALLRAGYHSRRPKTPVTKSGR